MQTTAVATLATTIRHSKPAGRWPEGRHGQRKFAIAAEDRLASGVLGFGFSSLSDDLNLDRPFKAGISDAYGLASRQRRVNAASSVANATHASFVNLPGLKGRAKFNAPLRDEKPRRLMSMTFEAKQRLISICFSVGLVLSGCRHTAAPTNNDNTLDTSTYRPLATPATEFEQKLKMVRDGGFRYVWVFRKLDGKEFTHEDTEILHTNVPKVVDWIGTDDRKTFIAGSNVVIPPANEPELKKRYRIEDRSDARP